MFDFDFETSRIAERILPSRTLKFARITLKIMFTV